MLQDNQIFIHVPKTGGTTLNCTLHGTSFPQDTSFNYRHIVSGTQLSNSGDIFNPLKNDRYRDYQIFMLLRHPVDRIVSEYYFIKERDMFFSKLKPRPKNFKEYALHKQTANYIVSFLLGNEIYASKRPTEEDLQQVINGIENLNITVGLFENFQESLDLFQKRVGIQWPKVIENKRVTIIRPEREEVSAQLSEQILKHHHLDLALYEYAKAKFESIEGLRKNVVKFKDNRYDFILTYTNNHFVLEMVLKGHPFLERYLDYFNELRRFLSTAKLDSGDEYLRKWAGAFIAALEENNLPLGLLQLIKQHRENHPTQFIKAFGHYIRQAPTAEWEPLKLRFSRNHIPQSKGFWGAVARIFG